MAAEICVGRGSELDQSRVNVGRTLLERAVGRDEVIVAAGLGALAIVSWLYLFRTASAMDATAAQAAMHAAMGMTMPGMNSSAAAEVSSLWLMWTIMMVAMMLPSAAPVALLVLGTYRRRGGQRAYLSSYVFVLGYLFVWATFSGAAAIAQVGLRHVSLISI